MELNDDDKKELIKEMIYGVDCKSSGVVIEEIFDLQKENSLLREQLRREQDLVDDFILMSEHADWCFGDGDDEECKCMNKSYYNLRHLTKIAKQIQTQRTVKPEN